MHVDLSTIGNGGLQERFDREFEKVVKNMKDPNTSYKEARKVTITLTLKQDEDRNACTCTCEVVKQHIEANPNNRLKLIFFCRFVHIISIFIVLPPHYSYELSIQLYMNCLQS